MTERTDARTPRAGEPRRSPAARLGTGMATLIGGVAAELAGGVVAVSLLWRPPEAVVWQPPRRPGAADLPDDVRRLDYQGHDGQPLFALVVEAPDGSNAGAVLAFHGNAELAAWRLPWARRLAALSGRRVVLPEYRGYAGLPGSPTYAHSARDARAAHAAARDALGAAPTALHGYSLGTAVAAELAAELADAGEPPEVLALEAPFASAVGMVSRVAPWPAVRRWWTRQGRVHFDTAARVAALDVPVWVAHGGLDAMIPVRMGRAVFRAARRPGELLVVGAAGHAGIERWGGARYQAWLRRALGAPPASDDVFVAQTAGTHSGNGSCAPRTVVPVPSSP